MTAWKEFLQRYARLLGFGVLASFASNFGQTYFIALFNDPIRAEFGLSHGAFGGLYSLVTAISGGILLTVGGRLDRMRLPNYALLVALGLATACALLAAAPHVAWLFPALLLLRLGGQGLMSHMGNVAIGRAFEARRGLALSLTSLGRPLGEAVFPLVGVALLASVGWRGAWLVCAATVLLVLAPALRWTAHGRGEPQIDDSAEDQPSFTGRRSLSRAQVLRRSDFWMALVAFLSGPCILTGLFFHQAVLADAKGWSLAQLAASFTGYAVFSLLLGLLAGPIVDRVTARRLVPLTPLPLLAALGVILWVQPAWGSLLYLSLAGASVGLRSVSGNALWVELFGPRHLGAIKAVVMAAMIAGTAVTPFLFGAALDAGVGMPALVQGSAVYVLAAIGLLATAFWWRAPR